MSWLLLLPCPLAQVPGYTISFVAGGGTSGILGDGGPATSASLSAVYDVAIDSSGNLYIADTGDNRIRKVSTSGTITTVAGGGTASANSPVGDGGPATSAVLGYPAAVAVDAVGNLYIADTENNRVRKVSASGTITTVAGPGSSNGALGDGGPATAGTLIDPEGIAVDAAGDLYIADTFHNRVRKVSASGIITTVAGGGSASAGIGDGGQATAATLLYPTGLAVDAAGNLYVADSGHGRIRVVSPAGIINTVAGDGNFGYSGDGGLATIAEIGTLVVCAEQRVAQGG